jgi:hypothetical protein
MAEQCASKPRETRALEERESEKARRAKGDCESRSELPVRRSNGAQGPSRRVEAV